jgi:dephospho-CoA kinase
VRLRKPRPQRSPVLAPYDVTWPRQAERIMARVRAAAADVAVRVDHHGSTAVPGLPAKDVIDLQLVVSSLADADRIADALSDAGFPRLDGEWWDAALDGEADTRWAKRLHVGADPARPVNLHVRPSTGAAWRLSLLFRDWLRDLAYQEVQRRALEAGRGISANAGMPDRIVGKGPAYLYVSLSCRPLTHQYAAVPT